MIRSISNCDSIPIGLILPAGMRRLLAAGTILLLLALLAGALSIPFVFESATMWYKFGLEKTSLRAGKVVGMAAGLLIMVQLPLAGRLKVLDRIFSHPGLIRQHRLHAWAIATLALLHPLLVLLPEGTLLIPVETRYWPEWLGVGLLAAIGLQFVCSRWRPSLKIAFHRWLPAHRIAGVLVAVLLVIHVLFVSETFSSDGLPRLAVLAAAACFGLIWLWVRFTGLLARKKPFAVARVEPAGLDSTCVELTPIRTPSMAYVPGQFVFVSFNSARVTTEPHAFTLSSTPSRPERLQFTIRACGDWTRSVKDLAVGDRAYIQGPFGRFGHLFSDSNRPLIMIAGGIGITPMLSMLRFMADCNDTRPILLIWSNRTRSDTVFKDELAALEEKLTGFRRIPIFTRISRGDKHFGRLDRQSLEDMVKDCSRRSIVFVCGPPQMMKQIKSDLSTLGFRRDLIFSESFGF